MSSGELGLAMAAFMLAPVVGGLLTGIDRKLSARMQGRIGPPILQPFYDFFKLWGKDTLVTTRENLIWAWGYLLLTMVAVFMFFFQQDLLIIFFVLAFAGACLIFGAFSVRAPYSHLGAHREILQMLAYEPILLLAAVAVFLKTGTFMITGVFEFGEPLLPYLPLTFVAILIALGIKMRKSPFDISACEHAHQEIVRGVYTEYSGRHLALITLTHWFEIVLILGFITLFWAQPLWIGLLIALGVFVLELIIDNISARLKWSWMLGVSWVVGIGFIIANMVLIYCAGGFIRV
ncbi:MAG: complex I subunit 1 family protein [Eubacteriales bacterium]|nr:complex I subunit 1 family protein [Clostridia bacterium]MDZ4043072.1 complex I subunit 1 family protein [Eubacteriales bacterium]MDZ7610414.1 complex I subunit 1 family protein [Eubacteriales bacterium]